MPTLLTLFRVKKTLSTLLREVKVGFNVATKSILLAIMLGNGVSIDCRERHVEIVGQIPEGFLFASLISSTYGFNSVVSYLSSTSSRRVDTMQAGRVCLSNLL